ncbi:MAG TPA: DUF2795 domain-containing protein [Acidimicrobiales bacterium]|jgi:hypothetical protein
MRGSDKHGPRVDDQMVHDTAALTHGRGGDSRVEEFRDQEGPGEGEPEVGEISRDTPLPGGMDDEALRERADIARHLNRAAFPGDRDTLVASAEENFAPEWVVERLRSLPAGQEFETVEQVWETLGGPPDPPRA